MVLRPGGLLHDKPCHLAGFEPLKARREPHRFKEHARGAFVVVDGPQLQASLHGQVSTETTEQLLSRPWHWDNVHRQATV